VLLVNLVLKVCAFGRIKIIVFRITIASEKEAKILLNSVAKGGYHKNNAKNIMSTSNYFTITNEDNKTSKQC
jgi:hypothetical protein